MKFIKSFLSFATVSLFCLLSSEPVLSQVLITLDDAIRIGLENNYGIRIAINEAEIPKINSSLGKAGFLPMLSTGASIEQLNETERELVSNLPYVKSNNTGNIVDAYVTLSWTIFDGLLMFSNYQQLKEFEKLGEIQSRLTIERIVLNVINSYFNIVSLERRINVLENSVEISNERVGIAQAKFNLGSGSEYDLLVAQTDLNADKTNLFREQAALNEARLNFCRLLNMNSDIEFSVTDEIEINLEHDFSVLKSFALQKNQELIAARIELAINTLNIRKVKQSQLPTIGTFASYYYNNTEYNNQIYSINKLDGLHFGITARWNIFNGFDKQRELSIAKIKLYNSELLLKETEQSIDKYLISTYSNYQNSTRLIVLEEQNLENATKTLEIAIERFRLGNITSLELRESQRTLLNTEHRLIEAQFQTKMFETELLHLTGSLSLNY